MPAPKRGCQGLIFQTHPRRCICNVQLHADQREPNADGDDCDGNSDGNGNEDGNKNNIEVTAATVIDTAFQIKVSYIHALHYISHL